MGETHVNPNENAMPCLFLGGGLMFLGFYSSFFFWIPKKHPFPDFYHSYFSPWDGCVENFRENNIFDSVWGNLWLFQQKIFYNPIALDQMPVSRIAIRPSHLKIEGSKKSSP